MTTLGLIVPLGAPVAFDHWQGVGEVGRLIGDGSVDSVWARDLPAVAPGDNDAGQGSDPWWHLGCLNGALGRPVEMGTASVILGVRHPLVVARAAAGAQIDTGGRFILGVGSGGKPVMNRALGIAGRSHRDFAAQWAELRRALATDGASRDVVEMRFPASYRPPPMYLATSDIRRWEAIEGAADGWQTFLTDDRRLFQALHSRISALRGTDTPADVRLDVHLIGEDDGDGLPVFTLASRGRVQSTAKQLFTLIEPWLGPPVGRVLLRVHGHAPADAIRRLRDAWP